jgi:hypothetical protein
LTATSSSENYGSWDLTPVGSRVWAITNGKNRQALPEKSDLIGLKSIEFTGFTGNEGVVISMFGSIDIMT